jgi:hypothetical protein
MRIEWLLRTASLLALVGSACHRGSPLEPPSGLTATQDPSFFDNVSLTWTAPVQPVDAYELQALLPGATSWQSFPETIPAVAVGAAVTFASTAPEAAQYSFRVRSLRGGSPSAFSNEAHYLRGVRPASNVAVYSTNAGVPFQVSWTRGSVQATQLRLERRIVATDGSATEWTQLPGAALADASFTDIDVAQWLDGARFDYRVIYRLNEVDSAPASGSSNLASPVAPVGLAAAPLGPTSIALQWTARSRYADRQIVRRGPIDRPAENEVEIATLPRDAASYTDTVLAPGVYRYRIVARVGSAGYITNYNGVGDPVQGFTTLPEGNPLRVSGLAMPAAKEAARDGTGAFALAGRVGSAGAAALDVFAPQAAGWATHAVSGDEDVAPGGVFYAAGALHVLHTHLGLPTAATIDERFDGQAWRADAAGVRISDAAVDSSTQPRAAAAV